MWMSFMRSKNYIAYNWNEGAVEVCLNELLIRKTKSPLPFMWDHKIAISLPFMN